MHQKNDNHTPADKPWAGASAALQKSARQVLRNPQPLLLYMLVSLVLIGLEAYAPFPGDDGSLLRLGSYETLGWLIFLLAVPTYALAIADGRKISLGDFMRPNSRRYLYVVGALLLAMLILGGSMLLLIVPIIWTAAWFAFGDLVVVDKGFGPIAALKESKRLAQNHKAKVWGVIGLAVAMSIAVGFIGILPMVGPWLGSIAASVAVAVTAGSFAHLYRWLQHNTTN